MPRLHREPLHHLIGTITSGELAEGDALPREADLAERFDVSRGVARESLRALEERGLIRVKHGRGATVRPVSDWDLLDGDVMAGMLAGPLAAHAVAASLECLRIVDAGAVALAAERAEAEDLVALSGALERMDEAAPEAAATPVARRRARKAELDFHSALMRSTQNLSLVRIGEPLHEALVTASSARRGTDGPAAPAEEYERILEAIMHGRADAARAGMQRCLDALERALLERRDRTLT